MQNLNKENFFNEMASLCPLAMEYFSRWINEYKIEVKWNEVFGSKVKFHHLPFEMQNGIIARFELELYNNKKAQGKLISADLHEAAKGQVRSLLLDLEKQIILRSSKLN